MTEIGTLGERSLHAALKTYLAQPEDRFEVRVDGFYIDILRETDDHTQLIEIQTKNFTALKRKLATLLESYRVHVVHPIAVQKWIVKFEDGVRVSRRKSPQRGIVEDVFRELIRIPHLIDHPNFSLEVLLVHEEEIRVNDGKGSWRRKGWSITDHVLLEVVERRVFYRLGDLRALLPESLPAQFTTKDLPVNQRLAQKVCYCLREAGAITQVGKQGRAYLYEITS